MYCNTHFNNQMWICIAPHSCPSQRRICLLCTYDHGVGNKHIVSIDQFKTMVIKKMEEHLSEESEAIKNFKIKRSETVNLLRRSLDDFLQSINQRFDLFESQFDLIDQNTKIEELPYNKIEQLVQIVGEQKLNDLNKVGFQNWKNFKQNEEYVKTIIQNVNAISNICKAFANFDQMKNKVQMQANQLNQSTKEFKGVYWNYLYNQPLQIKPELNIVIQKNNQISYFKDGYSLRIDQIKDSTKTPEILTNLEQIQYFKWYGNYGKKNQKIGSWTATWKGETILGLGGEYSDNGKKQGQWRDIFKNYWSLAKVFEVGQYVEDQRNGDWKYIYENNELGGGNYNKKGLKKGKWKDLSEGFWHYSQVIYNGEYQKGKKIGRWDIEYRKQSSESFQKIGGGSYNNFGDGLKCGNWVEISDNFMNSSQVTYKGEYQSGKKVGRWDIEYKQQSSDLFLTIGGLYDNGLKYGNWQEPSDNFMDSSQVIYNGGYQNGKKVGIWNIEYRKDINEKFQIIGGGQYNEFGDELKFGEWIEISNEFTNTSQIIYKGNYKNGKKVGRWDIEYRKQSGDPFFKIGGGSYDDSGDELKQGNWIEISGNFTNTSQVIYNGEYQKGKKIGRWDIEYRKQCSESFQKIGGGSYNNFGDGLKCGNWVEISDNFMNFSEVTYNGQYNKGQKVGHWNIYLNQNGKSTLIGGGLYDDKDMGKLGNWTELDDGFNECCQITYQGQYLDNRKVGRWDSQFEGKIIGGGSYDDQSIKNGKWVLLSNNFCGYNPVVYIGQLLNGEKVGLWDIIKIKMIGEIIIYEKIGQNNYQQLKNN